MLKLSGFDTLFAVAGNLYLLLALAGVCLALWLGKTWLRKGVYAVLVLAAFIAPLVPEVLRQTEFRNRQATAKSMFEERCKTAGEKILRTVENVEGVYLMKVRPKGINFGNQFELDDPYGRDFGGDAYIQSFARGAYQAGKRKEDISVDFAYKLSQHFAPILSHLVKDKSDYSLVDKSTSLACS